MQTFLKSPLDPSQRDINRFNRYSVRCSGRPMGLTFEQASKLHSRFHAVCVSLGVPFPPPASRRDIQQLMGLSVWLVRQYRMFSPKWYKRDSFPEEVVRSFVYAQSKGWLE